MWNKDLKYRKKAADIVKLENTPTRTIDKLLSSSLFNNYEKGKIRTISHDYVTNYKNYYNKIKRLVSYSECYHICLFLWHMDTEIFPSEILNNVDISIAEMVKQYVDDRQKYVSRMYHYTNLLEERLKEEEEKRILVEKELKLTKQLRDEEEKAKQISEEVWEDIDFMTPNYFVDLHNVTEK